MPIARRSAVPLLLLAACLLPPATHAAESYDACTGFIDSVPATIATQGVWCLRKDLSTGIASGNAITIATNNVTIDCNDFKLGGLSAGTASLARGIHAADRHNITIRNCGIRGFFYGIELTGSSGSGHLVEHNRLDYNLRTGIYAVGSATLVRSNRVHDTGGAPGSSSFAISTSGSAIDNEIDTVFSAATSGYSYGIDLTHLPLSSSIAQNNRIAGVTSSPSGSAYGIFGWYGLTVATGNIVVAPGTEKVTGYAITSMFACSHNVARGYQPSSTDASISQLNCSGPGNIPATP